MSNVRGLTSLLLFLLWGISLLAQPSVSAGVAADTAYNNKNWTEAEKLYEQLTQANNGVARYWYRLGISAHQAGHNEKALAALETAKAKGFPPFFADYGIAGIHASTGQKEKAFTDLEQALKAGFAQPDQLSSDADLQSLRGDPRFANLVEQAKHNQTPCEYSAENRQFDFWVGEWNVIPTAGGLPQGSSRIEKGAWQLRDLGKLGQFGNRLRRQKL